VAEQAVEDVRNVEDGTERELGSPRTWTPPVDVAKREANPKEGGLTDTAAVGRTRIEGTLQGSESSREDEPVAEKLRGTAREGEPTGSPETGKLVGRGEPDVPLVARIQHSEEPADPMRGSRRGGDVAAKPATVGCAFGLRLTADPFLRLKEGGRTLLFYIIAI
jgi:hypothetical protein